LDGGRRFSAVVHDFIWMITKNRVLTVLSALSVITVGACGGDGNSSADRVDRTQTAPAAQQQEPGAKAPRTVSTGPSEVEENQQLERGHDRPTPEEIVALTKRQGPHQVDRLSAKERRLRERAAKRQGKDQTSHLSAREQDLLEIGSKSPKYQP
jgi:hypothetical protein